MIPRKQIDRRFYAYILIAVFILTDIIAWYYYKSGFVYVIYSNIAALMLVRVIRFISRRKRTTSEAQQK